jgi:hypothetical protein
MGGGGQFARTIVTSVCRQHPGPHLFGGDAIPWLTIPGSRASTRSTAIAKRWR